MSSFKEINISDLNASIFNLFNKDWALLTSGDSEKYNTMTVSWGGMGILWNKNVATVYVRKSRYTLDFIDKSDYFSLTFGNDEMRKALVYCGKNSGRDVDKVKETGIVPVTEEKVPYFMDGKLVLICKKLYRQEMTEQSFLDKSIVGNYYADNDYHIIFVGEIEKALIKENS